MFRELRATFNIYTTWWVEKKKRRRRKGKKRERGEKVAVRYFLILGETKTTPGATFSTSEFRGSKPLEHGWRASAKGE